MAVNPKSNIDSIPPVTNTIISPDKTGPKAKASLSVGTGNYDRINNYYQTSLSNVAAIPSVNLPELAVARTTPRVGQTSVFPGTDILVTFNQAIQKGANFTAITVTDATGQNVSVTSSVWGDTLTIKPGTLAYDTLYTVTLPTGSVDGVGGNVLAAEYTFSFTTKFVITGTTPTERATGVSVNTPVTVIFSNIVREGPNFSRISLSRADDPSAPVSLNSVQLSGIDNNTRTQMTIIYQGMLEPAAHYQVTIPAGAVEDEAGRRLNADYSFDFRTQQTLTLPQVYYTEPASGAQGASVDQAVSIMFNDDIAAGPNYNGVALTVYQSGTPVAVSKQIVSDQLIITPAAALSFGTIYAVSIPAGAVTDAVYGDLLKDSYDFTFTTRKQMLVSTNPANGNRNVPIDTAPAVVFGQPIVGAQLDAVVLRDSAGNQVPVKGYVDGNTLIITPSQLLKPTTDYFSPEKYTVEVPAGTVLGQDGTPNDSVSFSFTTGASQYAARTGPNPFFPQSWSPSQGVKADFWGSNIFFADKFIWDFGDGEMGSGRAVSHTYANTGRYTVTLMARVMQYESGKFVDNYYTVRQTFDVKLATPPPPPPQLFNPETATLTVEQKFTLDELPGGGIAVDPGQKVDFELRLSDGAAYTGNQKINVYVGWNNQDFKPWGTVTTNSNGDASFTGQMPAWVQTGSGYTVFFKMCVGDRIKATYSMVVPYTAHIGGYVRLQMVTGDYAQPPVGTTVVLDGGKATATLDSWGYYDFGSVAPGTHRVKASAPGWEPAETTVEVKTGWWVDCDINLTKAVLSGQGPVVRGVFPEGADNSTNKTAYLLRDSWVNSVRFKFNVDWKGHYPGYVKVVSNTSPPKEVDTFWADPDTGEVKGGWIDVQKCPLGMLEVYAISGEGYRSDMTNAAIVVSLNDLPGGLKVDEEYDYDNRDRNFRYKNGQYTIPVKLNLPTLVTPVIDAIPVMSGAPAKLVGGETKGTVVLGPGGLVVTVPNQPGLSAGELGDIAKLEKYGTAAYKGLKDKKKVAGKKSPGGVGMIFFSFSRMVLNTYNYDLGTGQWVQDQGFADYITDVVAYYSKSIVPPGSKAVKEAFKKAKASLDLTFTLEAQMNSISETKLQDGVLSHTGGMLFLQIPMAKVAGNVSAGYGAASGSLWLALTGDSAIVWKQPDGPTQYYLDLVGGADVSLLWGTFTYERDFLEYEWGSPIKISDVVYEAQRAMLQSLSVPLADGGQQDGESPEPAPASRDYLERQSGWLPVPGNSAAALFKTMAVSPDRVFAAVNDGTIVIPLQYSIFPQSAQDVINTGNGAFMVLLLDNPDHDAMNRTQVNFSFYDGSAWSVPQPITPADSTGDFNPVVAQVAPDTMSAAWINLKPGITDSTSPSDLMSSTEIAVSNYDTATRQWGTVQKFVYGSDRVNLMPTIAGGNNKGLLLWVSAAEASGVVPSGSESIVFSRYDGSAWSVPEAVYNGLSGIVSSSLACDTDGTGIYAFSMSKGDQPDSANQIYIMKYDGVNWGSPIVVSDDAVENANPQVTYVDGRPLLVWWSDGRLVYCDDLNTLAVRDAEASGAISREFILAPNDSLHLVEVVGVGASADGRGIYTVPYDAANDTWGSPAKLAGDDGALLRSPSASFAGDGHLVTVYDKDNLVPAKSDSGKAYQTKGDTDLYAVDLAVVHKLSIPVDGLNVLQGNVMAGGLATVSAQVYNTGSFTENNITVGFYDGDPGNGGEAIGSVLIPGPLAPGAGAVAQVDWLVPLGQVTHEVYVVVDPLHQIPIADRSSSQASLPVVQPDLTVRMSYNQFSVRDYDIIAKVTNTGGIDISGATLTLSALNHTTGNKDVISTKPLNLGVRQSMQIPFLWQATADYVYQDEAVILAEINPADGVRLYSGDSIQDGLVIPVKSLAVTAFPPMDNIAVSDALVLKFNDVISPGAATVGLAASGVTPVAITTSMSGNVLTITPQAPLAYDTAYTLTVPANAVAGRTNDALAADFVRSFTTAGRTPAMLVNDLSGVPVAGTLTIPFTGEIKPGAAFNSLTLRNASKQAVAGVASVAGTMLKIAYAGLAYGTAYTVEIPDGALASGQGIPMAGQTLAFQTEAASNQPATPPASTSDDSPSSPAPVTSTSGSALVLPAYGGTVSLGDIVKLTIPPGALQGTTGAEIAIQAAGSPPQARPGFIIQGQVCRFTVNGQEHYTFNKPLTLTFVFDPSLVPAGANPTVSYYDDKAQLWVDLGGTVTGNLITVKVDHFTMFAVLMKAALQFADVTGTWAQDSITKLVARGGISGYPDGSFRPDNKITRAEFVTVVVKGLQLAPKEGPIFTDTRGTWAEKYVSTAAAYGIVSGYDAARFGPNDRLTREQMTAMVVKAAQVSTRLQQASDENQVSGQLPFRDAAAIDAWARNYVAAALKNGLVKGYGDGSFRPLAQATRAEAVTVVVHVIESPHAGNSAANAGSTTTAALAGSGIKGNMVRTASARVEELRPSPIISPYFARASAASVVQFDLASIGINSQPGYIYTAAGDFARYGTAGGYGGDGGSATAAGLNSPGAAAVDASGNIYIVDTDNNVIREVAATSHTQWGIAMQAGHIYTVAGSGYAGYSGDGGQAAAAELNYPSGVAVDTSGNLYIADMYNNVIREVAASDHTQWGIAMQAGHIYTVAGKYNQFGGGYSGDGAQAAAAELNYPAGVTVDAAGNLYIADMGNSVIREVAGSDHTQWGIAMKAGDIYTVAGDYARYGTSGGYGGDGGSAASAGLSYPNSVAVDVNGNLYLADSNNNVIREVAAQSGTQWGQAMTAGAIYTVAGDQATGGGYGGDGGLAAAASLNYPNSAAVDVNGNLYLADSNNNVIREVAAQSGTQWGQSMTAGAIYTVTGDQAAGGGYSGDGGIATAAGLNWPAGVTVDLAGNIYLADMANNVIRVSRSMDVTLAASPTGPAVGSNVNIKVTIKDDQGNPVSGQTVVLTGSGSAQITTVQGTTQGNGIASFSVTDAQAETVTLTAKVANLTLGTVQVTFWGIGAISGIPQAGSVLTAGSLTPAGAAVTYQWQEAESLSGPYVAIAGATGSTYTPVAADYGRYLAVVATGTGSYSGSVTSAAVGPVGAQALTGIGAISGTPQVGSVLTAGAPTPAGATLSYQWQEADSFSGPYVAIAGATGSTYTPVAADYGRYLRVVATGTGAYSGNVTSAGVGPVTAQSIIGIGAISGTPQVGSMLTAGALTPAGATVAYQWEESSTADGTYTAIVGATESSYTVAAAAYGHYLRVVATGTSAYSGSVTSAGVGPVTARAITGIGTISGTAQVGSMLTAGSLSPAGATVTYLWQEASSPNGTYSAIPGATGATYWLVGSDFDRYLTVVASGTGAFTGSITSGVVGPVAALPLTAATVSGAPQVGAILTAVLTPAGAMGTYQWERAAVADGPYSAIAGATGSSYTPQVADADQYLRVVVTGSGGYSGSVTSAPAGPVSTWALTLGIAPSAASGTAPATTVITASPNIAGDTLVVRVSSESIVAPHTGDAAPSGSGVTNPYIPGSNLGGVFTGDYVGIYEINGSGQVVAFSQIRLTSGDIQPPPGYIYMAAGRRWANGGTENYGDYHYVGIGGPATEAGLEGPGGVAFDVYGNMYISSTYQHVINVVPAADGMLWGQNMQAGHIYTVAGNFALTGGLNGPYPTVNGGYSGDGGPATDAWFHAPQSVAFDVYGNMYIADQWNHLVRMVAAYDHTQWGIAMQAGHIYTVAGDVSQAGSGGYGAGYSGDGGPATAAKLAFPSGVAIDAEGNLYIADSENNVVRMVAGSDQTKWGQSMQAGYIYTIAGQYLLNFNGVAVGGYSGDGGSAAAAELKTPWGVTVDSAGNLYIADGDNNVIREVAAQDGMQWGQSMQAGYIYTVVGNPDFTLQPEWWTLGIGDGGLATEALLDFPAGIAFDAAGNMYINDQQNLSIREVAAQDGTQWGQSMQAGHIYTVAGDLNAGSGNWGDGGTATAAGLDTPASLALNAAGDIYIGTFGNYVRAVTVINAVNSTVVASPDALAVGESSTITVTLKDGIGNPVSGRTVVLTADGGSSSITPLNSTTQGDGTATFSISDSQTETVTYTAMAGTLPIGTVNVTFWGTTPLTGMGAVSGTPQVGSVLTAGALTPAGATATYQWEEALTSDGTYTAIPGATGSSYTVSAAVYGRYLRLVVTASGEYCGRLTSAAVGPVAAQPLTAVTVSGTPQVGGSLTAVLTPVGATATYQWERAAAADGPYSAVAYATGNSYSLGNWSEANQYLRVVVTGSGGYSGSVTSTPVGPISP